MEIIKKTTAVIGFAIGAGLMIVAIVLVVTVPLTLLSHTAASFRASERCYVKGFVKSDVVVNWPAFWNVQTTCFTNDGSQSEVL